MSVLAKNIMNLYGKKGERWLMELPQILVKMEEQYGLSALKPVKNLSYNYVLFGFQGTRPIVLKLSLDIESLKQEAAALKAFAGFGAVSVLAENKGSLLLEGLNPGIALKSYFPEKEQESIDIAAKVMKHLHEAPQLDVHVFPHIRDWILTLDNDLNIPENYLQKARQLRDHLLSTSPKEVLLHGDLHHDNILQNGNHWMVIDPKGVIGEPAYEVTAFIRNPIPDLLDQEHADHIILNRASCFAKMLGLPESRILDWCFVQAVLSWAWTLEDGGDDAYFRKLTACFDKLRSMGS